MPLLGTDPPDVDNLLARLCSPAAGVEMQSKREVIRHEDPGSESRISVATVGADGRA
jgi:hypothetical protein